MTNNVIKATLLMVLLTLSILPGMAVRAYYQTIQVRQPDGSTLQTRLNGDEHFHYRTTADGYLIAEDSLGVFKYATVSNNNILVSSYIARDVNKRTASEAAYLKTINKDEVRASLRAKTKSAVAKVRSMVASRPQKAYPLNGSPKALVILANFSDKSFVVTSPQTSFQNLVTQSGYSANGGTGSAKDYFMSSSYGKFAPNFEVFGPVTLPKTLAYYGTNDADGYDTHPGQMIADACAAADAAGLDFSKYDTDNDGYVDNVFVYYAGYNEAEGAASNTIWPHRWDVASAGVTTGITFDGKTISDYSCTSELKGTSGSSMCGIGTFCHEFGHVLGLPDFYDTSGTQDNTLNTWDVMDYGPYLNNGRTPPAYSAYERFFLGYLTPQQVSTASNLTLSPMYLGTTTPASTDQQAYLLSATTHNLVGSAPSPKEFFIVEYRKHTGFDTYLGQLRDANYNLTTIPADGMCIWHVDYDATSWTDNAPNNYTGTTQTASSHMRVYLQPLSGSTTTPGTTFTSGSFTPTTWTGTNINRAITEITTSAANVTFKLMGGYVAPALTTTGSFSSFSAVSGSQSSTQSIGVNGTNLTGNVNITLLEQSNFDIKLSTSTTWGKSVSVVPASGVVSSTLDVRYNPTTVGTHSDKLTIATEGCSNTDFNLSGIATSGAAQGTPTILLGNIIDEIKFPGCKVGNSKAKTLTVKTSDLHGDITLSVGGTDAAQFMVSSAKITKADANNGTNITITFAPGSTGTHAATLTISGGGLTNDLIYTLSGVGL